MALGELLIRDFPEFKNIAGKLLSDMTLFDMLSEYARCKNVCDKFLESDQRRMQYNTIIDELRNEIRQRIMRSFFHQY